MRETSLSIQRRVLMGDRMTVRTLILGMTSCAALFAGDMYSSADKAFGSTETLSGGKATQALEQVSADRLRQRFLENAERARSLLTFLQSQSTPIYDVQKAYLLLVYFWTEAVRVLFEDVMGLRFDAMAEEGRWCNRFIEDLGSCLSLNPNGTGFVGLIPQQNWNIDAVLDAVLDRVPEADEDAASRLRQICLLLAIGAQPKAISADEEPQIQNLNQTLQAWGYNAIKRTSLSYRAGSGFSEGASHSPVPLLGSDLKEDQVPSTGLATNASQAERDNELQSSSELSERNSTRGETPLADEPKDPIGYAELESEQKDEENDATSDLLYRWLLILMLSENLRMNGR